MIASITNEQWREIYTLRDRYREIGLSTAPANRPEAEAAISELYELKGEAQPRFVWLDGPKDLCLAYAVVQLADEDPSTLPETIDKRVKAELK